MSYVYITEENARIQKKNGRFLVGRNLEILFEIPEETLEGLVLIGSVQVSSQAMISLLQLGIPVTWISGRGKFFGRLESTSHVNVFKHQKQVLMQDTSFALDLARKAILAKIHNQIVLLQRHQRRKEQAALAKAIAQMQALRKHVHTVASREELMGHEGSISRVYFSALGQIVPPEFAFTKRSKQPPLDSFNTMLSFGYTLLMYDIYTAISNQGFHPYFGFLHALKNHHPALASDLMEEWRAPIVDSMVLSLISHHEIVPEHFARSEDGVGIFLNREGRTIFLRAYEKKLRSLNPYGEQKKTYRQSLETQVSSYGQALMNEDTALYKPLYTR